MPICSSVLNHETLWNVNWKVKYSLHIQCFRIPPPNLEFVKKLRLNKTQTPNKYSFVDKSGSEI